MTTMTPTIIGPTDGKAGFLGSIGVRFMIDGAESDERFSPRRAPDATARARGAPAPSQPRRRVQLRARGPMGALLGDDVVEAGPGDLVFKPRGQWHTFWNAGDEPCQILEIISPAGSSSSSPSSTDWAAR